MIRLSYYTNVAHDLSVLGSMELKLVNLDIMLTVTVKGAGTDCTELADKIDQARCINEQQLWRLILRPVCKANLTWF